MSDAAPCMRLLQYCIEHWREVAGRGIDDLQDLGGGSLLIECFAEFGGALLDLLFQLRIGFLQVGGHAVEPGSEPFELVAGVDLDAAVELAGADPCRTRL